MKRIFLLLALLVQSAAAQPILTKTVLSSYSNLVAHPSTGNEAVTLTAYSSTAPLLKPILYTLKGSGFTSKPPMVVPEVSGKGYWVADCYYTGELDPGLFGVVANGVVDDTIAWQNAINYAYSNNIPTILVPPRTTKISSLSKTGSLQIGGLSFRGFPGERSIFSANSTGTMFSFTSFRNLSFEDVWFSAGNLATNILTYSDATHCNIKNCVFYESPGTGLRYIGPQNYGHIVEGNNFVNNAVAGIVLDADSTAAIDIRANTFQTSGGAYTNTAIGIWVRRNAVNIMIHGVNIFQSLKNAVVFDGSPTGGQIGNIFDYNYTELIAERPVKLLGSQHTTLSVQNNFFNQEFTQDKWAVKDTNGTVLYGMKYKNNAITPDAGKALSLTNSLVRGWDFSAGPGDIATDYELPSNVAYIFDTQSQRLLSLTQTNFTVTLGSSTYSIAGDLLPNRVEMSANSNAYFNINGFVYDRTAVTLYNSGTNVITFLPTGQAVRAATEDTFMYRNGNWRRERLSYLPDEGGTIYGSLNVTNDVNIYDDIMVYGDLTVNGTIENPWAYISYGSLGGTNLATYNAKPGAVIGFLKDGSYYAFIGTNGVTRFTTPIEMSAVSATLTHFAGWTNDPATGGRLHSMTAADVRTALGITSGVAAGNGISVTSGTNVSANLLAGAGILLTTNGSAQVVINNIGTNAPGSTNGTAFYVDSIYNAVVNFINSAELDPAVSGTNLTVTIVANSIETNKVSSAFRSFFLDRANHTGTQLASTISDFADATWAQFTNSMVASNNITFAYDTSNKKLMISSTASGASTVAVDGVLSTNINLADSPELLVTKTGTNVTYALAATAVTNGVYSNPTLSVDSKGRITGITNGSVNASTNLLMWQTIGGVRFYTTNSGGGISVSSASYTGNVTNILTVGSALPSSAVYFSLDFPTPRSDTNYLVYLDVESDEATGSAALFVGDGVDFAGRRTNGVTFAIVATTGSVNYNMEGRWCRVWIVDPNVTISTTSMGGGSGSGIGGISVNGTGVNTNASDGSTIKFTQSGGSLSGYVTNLTGELISSGTIDDARIPAGIARDSEMALLYGALVGANVWTGSQQLLGPVYISNLTATTFTVTNLLTSNWTNSGTLTTSNLVINGTATGPTAAQNSSNTVLSTTAYADRAAAAAAASVSGTNFWSDVLGYGTTSILTASNSWYFPATTRSFLQSTLYAHGARRVAFDCTIIGFTLALRVSTTSTATGIPCNIRTNDAGDVSVGSYSLLSTGDYTTNVSGLNIPLNAGDTWAFRYSPTNSDSPAVGGWMTVYFQRR